jgi:hypothetical protein
MGKKLAPSHKDAEKQGSHAYPQFSYRTYFKKDKLVFPEERKNNCPPPY